MGSAIKIEVDHNTKKSLHCHGCLSQDRKLKALSGDIYKVYYSLLGSGVLYNSEDRLVCWECEATLRRVSKFQNQIQQAQTKLLELFYNMSPKLETLSNLTVSTKDHYDLFYEFIEQTYIQLFPEIEPASKPIELSLIKDCVKVENFKKEPSTSFSDDDSLSNNDTASLEVSHESKTSPVKNKPIKVQHKNDKSKSPNFRMRKYLKHATVRNLDTKFGTVKKYFKEELLDFEEVEKYVVKPDQNDKWIRWNKCKECRIFFRTRNLLLMHKNFTHFKPGPFITCLVCKLKLPNLDKLRIHWKFTHSTFYKCSLCDCYCGKSGRIKHLNEHHTKIYSCNKCLGEFRSERHFKLHFKDLHDTYICHHCGKMSKNRSSMIKHILIHSDKHICEICNKNYKHRRFLVDHITSYHPETINKKVDKEALYCVECDKQFKTKSLFSKHLINKHTQKTPQSIPCPECGKTFTRKSYMINHLHKVHMTEKARFKCTVCEKLFINNWSLKYHTNHVHLKLPKEKNLICDFCGRAFHLKRTLINHRRTHTGERPYQCCYCSATFTQRAGMLQHQRSHHADMSPVK